MTLILETSVSDIHRCPGCGAPCAVDRDRIAAAENAGQKISIACHKCEDIFTPDNDNHLADEDRGSRPTRPHPNTRIGLCSGCGGRFSLQPLAAEEAVQIECPHCAFRMLPDEVARLDARSEIMAMKAATLPDAKPRRRWTRFLVSLLLGGALLAGIGIAALERFTPDLVDLPFSLYEAAPAARIAVTDTGFQPVGGNGETGDSTVLVTVTLANLGTTVGAPERVVIKLLDSAGNMILRRPIAAREVKLQPGTTRTLISRMAAPAPVADMLVELTRQSSGD